MCEPVKLDWARREDFRQVRRSSSARAIVAPLAVQVTQSAQTADSSSRPPAWTSRARGVAGHEWNPPARWGVRILRRKMKKTCGWPNFPNAEDTLLLIARRVRALQEMHAEQSGYRLLERAALKLRKVACQSFADASRRKNSGFRW